MTAHEELGRIVNRSKVSVGRDAVSMKCRDHADADRAFALVTALGRKDPYRMADTAIVTWKLS